MGQTILTPEQRNAFDFLKSQRAVTDFYYLSGGTALAEYYLGHRYSEDFDFFTDKDDIPHDAVDACIRELKNYIKAGDVSMRRIYDRKIFFLKKGEFELKVEFTRHSFTQIGKTLNDGNLAIDSLEDIAANKLNALMDRLEAKDFVDIYYLCMEKKFDLLRIADLFHKKFGAKLESVTLGSECAKARRLQDLPRMIKPLALDELKKFFEQEARTLAPSIFHG